MFHDYLILLILILLSAFFSGSEMAFIISNKLKIEVRAKKKNYAAQSANYFVQNPQKFYSTILIGNNIINVAFASLASIVLLEAFGWSDYKILIVVSVVTMLFGELIPKYFARETADVLILFVSIPLRIISIILYPLIKLMDSFIAFLSERKKETAENIAHIFDKDDIKILVDEGHSAGKVKEQEKNIISKVFDFSEQKVYEAMRPRTEIAALSMSEPISKAVDLFIETNYSKLIIYEDNIDNIKGFILAKDLFDNPSEIQQIIREIKYYPETKRSVEILNEFLKNSVSIAVVIDEFGGTAGIVTMEDIIEELFGEIRDEYDVEEFICRKISRNSYIVSGKVEIDHINDKYKLEIPVGDYETIAGFIIEKTGYIPKVNEIIKIDNFEFVIIRANKVRVDLVKLTLLSDDD